MYNINSSVDSGALVNTEEVISRYSGYAHETLFSDILYPDGEVLPILDTITQWDRLGQKITAMIINGYWILLLPLFVLFWVATVGTVILSYRNKNYLKRTLWADLIVPFSLFCLTLLRFAMLAFVEVGSAFYTLRFSSYLSGNYPVFLAMLVLGGLFFYKHRSVWGFLFSRSS